MVKRGRLRWFEHVERKSGECNTAFTCVNKYSPCGMNHLTNPHTSMVVHSTE